MVHKYILFLFIFFFHFDLFGFYTYDYKSKPLIKIETKEWKIYTEVYVNSENKIGLFFIKSF